MNETRQKWLDRINAERERQFLLPGSEWDARNTVNDWIGISTHYLSEETRRGGVIPSQANFEDSLVKAAAVIVAALERSDHLKERGELK